MIHITAYSKLKPVENPQVDRYGDPENDETEWRPGRSMKWSQVYLPGLGVGIDPQIIYSFEQKKDIEWLGCSGYNGWRHTLREFVHRIAYKEPANKTVLFQDFVYKTAFRELVDFVVDIERSQFKEKIDIMDLSDIPGFHNLLEVMEFDRGDDYRIRVAASTMEPVGVVGHVVATKLAKDFADYADKAESFSKKTTEGELWLNKYYELHKAFDMASDGGAVEFH